MRIISFTSQGAILNKMMCDKLQDIYDITLYSAKKGENRKDICYVDNVSEWVSECFSHHLPVIFTGACGIAVRMIAPFVKDKLADSPVLVIDELGKFVIPILSGHVGGANEIARILEKHIGCMAVITTATDVQNVFAIDSFAKNNALFIKNKEGIAKVSSKVLDKKSISFLVEQNYKNQVDVVIGKSKEIKSLLTLVPREYIIGIGCKKGKDGKELEDFVNECLEKNNISWQQIKGIASIDKKKEETAIMRLAQKYNRPFWCYSAEYLKALQGEFTESEFVKEQVGVGNVCERAAAAACEKKAEIIQHKIAKDGMTLAIAKTEWRLTVYEE